LSGGIRHSNATLAVTRTAHHSANVWWTRRCGDSEQ